MSSVVHFKFRSSLKFDSIRFNGHEISVQELKEEIVKSKKFDKFMEQFDLVITNDQTKIEYKPDDFVPKNSSVIVARLPIIKPKRDLQKKAVSPPVQTAENESTLECISKMTDVASMNLSEEDKLITVMDQGNREFDNVNYNKLKKVPRGPVPKNYICHRCGMPGHFIQKCPRARDASATESFPKLKRSTGIPISFMTTVDDINTPGVLLTSCGRLAVPIIDAEAYRIGKKEKPLFVKSDTPEKDEKEEIPKELTCPVCKDLLTEAVVLPCCGDSACDNCVMTELLQSTSPKCPVCKKSGISPLGVIPNKSMRTAVFNYKNETGYTAMSRKDTTTNSDILVKTEPEAEKKPILVNINLKPETNLKVELLPEDKPIEPVESLTHAPEMPCHESKPQPEVQEMLPMGSQLPIGEPVPIPGMKGAKMVRVLVARPGAPLTGDQTMSGAPFNQMSAMNMYSLPPPPLPHNYHTIITQPGMLQHGASAMPLNQARNSHVLIYPGTIPSRVIGPPPSLVPMGSGAPMQMTYPPRIPGAMPIAMPIPGVGRMPMTEEEFYREKERLRELERKRHQTSSMSPYSPRRDSRPARRKDVFEFAEDIMYKKAPRTRRRSRSRSYLRSRSRSKTRRSSSFTTKSSPSLRERRHRSRSKMKMYRNSRTPIRKSPSSNRSPSLRKDMPGKIYRESARLSASPNKPKGRRSITPPRKGDRQSRSPKKFFRSSRSISSQRSFGRPRSRSRTPMRKTYLRDGEPPANCRSDKMAYKRKSGASSRSPPPPVKRQKDLTDFRGPAYSPYVRVRRSRTPSRRRPLPTSRNPERYIEKSHPGEDDYYRHYKEWHDKYDKDRQDAARIHHRERNFSGSSPQRKRLRSRDLRSRSRESPPFKGERRVERLVREHEKVYTRERFEKNDLREQKVDARSMRPDKKDYNCRNKEIGRFIESEDVGRSELRKESFKDMRVSEDKLARRDDERKIDYSSKDLLRVETEKDARSTKASDMRSPPPKSKVQLINPKEAHSSSSELSQVPKETSVRIVTKDTCKTMKITVSSKWDSDKDHEKRSDKSHMTDVALDKTSTEEVDKTLKHKKKHKKEKKKHAKKHKSKGPE